MLGAIRRYGVAQALRASVPRSLQVRSTPQLLQLQPTPVSRLPAITRSFHNVPAVRSTATASVQQDDSLQSEGEQLQEFSDLQKYGLVDRRMIDTITGRMKITTMTDVQSKTFRESLKGDDILAQAKTGTGKTLAFLVPVIQRLMDTQSKYPARQRRGQPTEVRAIVISPTRELAEQIAVQAQILVQGTGINVQTAVGGSGKKEGLLRIHRYGCDLLIGTPGRLKDILSDPFAGIKTNRLSAFVLDEADRLLDDGFAPEIMQIQKFLPHVKDVDRQTLLFSATVPNEVLSVVRATLKPDFTFVKTVSDNEVPTHQSVPQRAVVLRGLENTLPAVLEVVKSYQAEALQDSSKRPFKAIVYFNSTGEVSAVHNALEHMRDNNGRPFLGEIQVFGIHGRLTQGQRNFAANSFRRSQSAVLISSDVTARGMDFPDVTHVIQVGVPRDRATYIHRLGRTARANKTGEGWTFLHHNEFYNFAKVVNDIPVKRDDKSLATATVDMTMADLKSDSPLATEIISSVSNAMTKVDPSVKKEAYMAQIGASKGFPKKHMLVGALNDLAIYGYRMAQPPSINPLLAQRLGLSDVPGVNIRAAVPFSDMVGGERKMSRGGLGNRGSGGFGGRGRFNGGGRGGFDNRERGGFGGFGGRERGGFNDRGRFGDREHREFGDQRRDRAGFRRQSFGDRPNRGGRLF